MAWPTRGFVFADRMAAAGAGYGRLSRTAKAALFVLLGLYLVALLAPMIAPYDPSRQLDIVALKSQPPSMAHPFGTDSFSRDVLTRVMYGTRVSLSIALLAVMVSAAVGTVYGLVAAAAGGLVDSILMRLLDAMLAIPRVLLLLAILAIWSPVPLATLVLLLGLTGWFETSRLVRAEALTLRERDFVTAARSLGAGRRRIVFRHLLPNVLVPVIVAATLGIGNVIVLEAGLSFIGVGTREPAASLGTMFQQGTQAFAGTWWLALFPGLVLVASVLAVNVLGDGLRTLLDPRQVHAARPGTPSAASAPAVM